MRLRLPGEEKPLPNTHVSDTGADARAQKDQREELAQQIADMDATIRAAEMGMARAKQKRLAASLASVPKGIPEDMRLELERIILSGGASSINMMQLMGMVASAKVSEEERKIVGANPRVVTVDEMFEDYEKELEKGTLND